jgi:transcriptional regulator
MHPNPAFAWTDETAMRGFIAERAFAHVFAATPDGPMVAHAPVTLTDGGDVRFHLARNNRLTAHLDGLTALISVAGPDAYVSPDWYGRPDQVPTWIYVAVEAEGTVRRLTEGELVGQLDQLSAAQEAALAPKPAWTRRKMAPGRFEAMLPGIVGFEMRISALRGTVKLNQHKPAEDVNGMIAGLEARGETVIARLARDVVNSRDGERAGPTYPRDI